MSHLVVHGGVPLSGRIVPSANKNAVLPVLCATLLTRETVRLQRVPASDGPLRAVDHWLPYASVTTTENSVLCAALASGTSTLTNAASEPHVQEFCRFMNRLGARIAGIGTSRLVITGVDRLGGGELVFAEDFHEIVTFLALGAISGGAVSVKNSAPEQFPLIDRCFAQFGVLVRHEAGWSHANVDGALAVREPFTRHVLAKIEAAPWPYLPVDLLPLLIALGVHAQGSTMFWNKVYDGALGWTAELAKFGAHAFTADPHRVVTFGAKPLVAAEVESPYIIRVAIALLMVAAGIPGRSVIRHAGRDPARAPAFRREPRLARRPHRVGRRRLSVSRGTDWPSRTTARCRSR